MTCDAIRDLLSAHLDGELDEAERRAVDAHLAACAGCAAEREALRRTVGLVKGLPREAAPAALADLVRAALPAAEARTVLPSQARIAAPVLPRRRLITFPRVAAAMAAGILVGVAIRFAYEGSGAQPPRGEQTVATAPPAKRAPSLVKKADGDLQPVDRLREADGAADRSAKPARGTADAELARKSEKLLAEEMFAKGRTAPGAAPAPAEPPTVAAAPAPPPAAPRVLVEPPRPPAKSESAPAAKAAAAAPPPSGPPVTASTPVPPPSPVSPARPAAPPKDVAVAETATPGAEAGGGAAPSSGPAVMVSLGAGDPVKQAELLDQLAYGGETRRSLDAQPAQDAVPQDKAQGAKSATDPAGRGGGAGNLAEVRRRAVQQAVDRKEPATLVYDLEPADAARFMARLAERQDIRVANVQADPGFFDIFANAAKPADGVSGAYRKLVDRSRVGGEGPVELARADGAAADLRKREAESLEKAKQTVGGMAGEPAAGERLALKDAPTRAKAGEGQMTLAAKADAGRPAAVAAAPPAAAAPAARTGGVPAEAPAADDLALARAAGARAPAAPPAGAAAKPAARAEAKSGAAYGAAPAVSRRVRIVIRLATD